MYTNNNSRRYVESPENYQSRSRAHNRDRRRERSNYDRRQRDHSYDIRRHRSAESRRRFRSGQRESRSRYFSNDRNETRYAGAHDVSDTTGRVLVDKHDSQSSAEVKRIFSRGRTVFIDEAAGNINCRARECAWVGNCDELLRHFSEEHPAELVKGNDEAQWKYRTEAPPFLQTVIADISGALLWIYLKADDDTCVKISTQYVNCFESSEAVFTFQLIDEDSKLVFGDMTAKRVLPNNVSVDDVFDQSAHVEVPMEKIVNLCGLGDPLCQICIYDNAELAPGITGLVGDQDDDFKKQSLDFIEAVEFEDEDAWNTCPLCREIVHISDVTMCDNDHKVCIRCKENLTCCHVCKGPYSQFYKNPFVQKIMNIVGMDMENL